MEGGFPFNHLIGPFRVVTGPYTSHVEQEDWVIVQPDGNLVVTNDFIDRCHMATRTEASSNPT